MYPRRRYIQGRPVDARRRLQLSRRIGAEDGRVRYRAAIAVPRLGRATLKAEGWPVLHQPVLPPAIEHIGETVRRYYVRVAECEPCKEKYVDNLLLE